MREKARREAREQREEQKRIEAEANRTSAQRHGDAIAAMGTPEAKAAANAAFIASLHGSDAPLSLDSQTPDFDGGIRVPRADHVGRASDEHNQAVLGRHADGFRRSTGTTR